MAFIGSMPGDPQQPITGATPAIQQPGGAGASASVGVGVGSWGGGSVSAGISGFVGVQGNAYMNGMWVQGSYRCGGVVLGLVDSEGCSGLMFAE